MIWKAVRKNISALQMAGYAVAACAGLGIVLSAMLFYIQVSALLAGGGDSSAQYLIISRPVSTLSTLGLSKGSAGFSQADIADLESQPWAAAIGSFTPAAFSVAAGVEIGGSAMSTQLFLESVPDEFLDQAPERWDFSPTDGEVSIIIPRDYLALYNFGYAASRGMPQMSDALLKKIPITLALSGNGHADRLRGRIAGFSDRINTIAVPQAFMLWANERYGSPGQSPSRLIVRTDNPGDPAIARYLEERRYEVAGDKSSGQAAYALRLVSSIVAGVGLAICALAIFILMLSVALMLQKNRDKNAMLLFLGYSPSMVGAVYIRIVAIANAAVLAGALLLAWAVSPLWTRPLAAMGIASTGWGAAAAAAVATMALVTALSAWAIVRSLSSAVAAKADTGRSQARPE